MVITGTMIAFLKLIRLPNLLIIAATQYLMRFCVLGPLLLKYDRIADTAFFGEEAGFHLQMGDGLFFLLVLSTVLITAAGYVINDYFDTKTDRLNKPETVVVGTRISRRMAMFIHILLNIAGVALGVYISFRVGKPEWGVVFFIVAGMLWFYSTTYKRQFLIGNLLVAFLTAMVPFMVALFEIPLLNQAYGETLLAWQTNFNLLVYWILGFSFFAFLTTLIREVIKDVEDFEGDRAYGRNTLPIVIGVPWTRVVISVLIAITLGSLFFAVFKFLHDPLTMIYAGTLIGLPLLFTGVYVFIANTSGQFRLASWIMKGIMSAGVLYAVLASYLIHKMF